MIPEKTVRKTVMTEHEEFYCIAGTAATSGTGIEGQQKKHRRME
jgi:hypothetical protein